jgi:hypothetical protein
MTAKNVPAETVYEAASESAPEVRETPDMEPSKRRMPDNLRRFLIRMQGGKMYLPAAYRIVWFRDELGDDWGIRTELLEGGHEAGFATVKAEIMNPEGRIIASGLKTEAKTDFPAGWVEKAESGSIARALAVLGFGTQFMPELDDDGYRPADSPQAVRQNTFSSYRPPEVAAREERPAPVAVGSPNSGNGPANGVANGSAKPQPAQPLVSVTEIWTGPGQCPRCYAPEGKKHGKACTG